MIKFIIFILSATVALVAHMYLNRPISYDGDKCKLIWNEVISQEQSIVLLECKP